HRRGEYQCAAERLAPFTESRDQLILLAAAAPAGYYRPFCEFHQDAHPLTTPPSSVTPRGPPQQLETIKSLKDTAEVSLVRAVAQTPYALVQWGPNGEATGRLNITSSERRQLLRLLEQSFGPGVRASNPGTADPWEAAGRLIYKVLT